MNLKTDVFSYMEMTTKNCFISKTYTDDGDFLDDVEYSDEKEDKCKKKIEKRGLKIIDCE